MKEITVFAKRRQTSEGRTFYTFLTSMDKNDGTKCTMSVKFRDECGTPKPENCPLNIKIEKSDVNISTKEYTVPDTGEIATSRTLWVTKWENGTPYVDHSTDEFF